MTIYCRLCSKARWKAAAPTQALRRTAKRHNLGEAMLKGLLADGCGVCGSNEQLDVDHDHSCCSGTESCGTCVRGVLCRVHNMALGHLGDNLDGVMRLVRYLED